MYDDEKKEDKIRYMVTCTLEGEFFVKTNLNREDAIKEITQEMRRGGYIDFAEDAAIIKEVNKVQIIKEYNREKVKA